MKRSLNTFLLWFLILVLPLHAVAAQVGMSCALGQQSARMSAVAQQHEHQDNHSAHTAAQNHEATAADHEMSSPDALGDVKHSSCSACSAFCIGAIAPPSSSIAVPAYDGAEQPVSSPAEPGAGFIPDGLQRPPRSI